MPSDDLSQFETKLRRSLMPPALSDAATESIHALLDELAGAETNMDIQPASAAISSKSSPWAAAAAAVAALFGVAAWFAAPILDDLAFLTTSRDGFAADDGYESMHLVDESTRLAWVEDEGWLDDPDGGALRAVRMRVIEENRLLDEETGIIVHVSSPREEMLLMPVSTF